MEIHTFVLPYILKEPRKIKQPEIDNNIQIVIEKKLNGKQAKEKEGKEGEAHQIIFIINY